jgi:hypothetical protein
MHGVLFVSYNSIKFTQSHTGMYLAVLIVVFSIESFCAVLQGGTCMEPIFRLDSISDIANGSDKKWSAVTVGGGNPCGRLVA